MTVEEYFDGPETLYPMELVHGVVREPPAPRYGHQSIVTLTTVLLTQHVRDHKLGVVCVSPIDVVLDRKKALVVQPDVLFVSTARAAIIRERIWGAPDLVVEVLSRRTAVRDTTVKLGWYRHYGVAECWFMDPQRKAIEIVDCQVDGGGERSYAGQSVVGSLVLPALGATAAQFFDL
jgi:Uma2 family endonuclease